jgi:hypothetical protein
VICGYSIGPSEKVATGTLGCLVRSRSSEGETLLLSNSHVLANSGAGQPGDPIYQPGASDAEPSEPVARLAAWKPFEFGDDADNHIDAAVAKPLGQGLFKAEIYDIGRPKGVRGAERGMMVQKSGRTSGHTWGQVEDVDFAGSIPYTDPAGGGYFRVKFSDQVLCTRYTENGDSGALVLDKDCYAVGLHFCGSRSASAFNPIQSVLDEMNVDLVT